jgi:hypothetical protein
VLPLFSHLLACHGVYHARPDDGQQDVDCEHQLWSYTGVEWLEEQPHQKRCRKDGHSCLKPQLLTFCHQHALVHSRHQQVDGIEGCVQMTVVLELLLQGLPVWLNMLLLLLSFS